MSIYLNELEYVSFAKRLVTKYKHGEGMTLNNQGDAIAGILVTMIYRILKIYKTRASVWLNEAWNYSSVSFVFKWFEYEHNSDCLVCVCIFVQPVCFCWCIILQTLLITWVPYTRHIRNTTGTKRGNRSHVRLLMVWWVLANNDICNSCRFKFWWRSIISILNDYV